MTRTTTTTTMGDADVRLETIPTPAMVLHGAVVRRNLKRLADYAAAHKLGVRPHTKTHKSVELARLQLDAGAIGLTVAKAGELEVMAATGAEVLLAYPAVDEARCRRIAEAARGHTVRVAIDSSFAAERLAEAARRAGATIGLLVEIDVGMGRTGVESPAAALALAQRIDGLAGVRLDGIMCYPGHIWAAADEQAPLLEKVDATLRETIELWARSGLAAAIVSGGSTPTAYQSHRVTSYTEIRPGTYIFNDINEVRGGFCTLDDCAARIVCTVVSTAVEGQVVIDAGSKTLTSDLCVPARDSGHGYIVEFPEAKITRLSEEHGQVDIRGCAAGPRLGQRVTVIPNHICPCVNLQDSVWWMDEGGSVRRMGVDARGKLS